MTNFKLVDTPIFVDLREGHYNVWITGGLSVSLPDDFQMNVTNKASGIKVPVYTNRLKVRDFNEVNYFHLDIPSNDRYEISIENYQGIVVKKTMLFITKLFFPKVAIQDIGLKLQKKG